MRSNHGFMPDPILIAPATHHGPGGPVRARLWSGHPGGVLGFLDGPGNVAWWFDGEEVLVVDCEGGDLACAHPGDWLVWAGTVLHVIGRAVFAAHYRQIH